MPGGGLQLLVADIEHEAYGSALRLDGGKGIVQSEVIDLGAQCNHAFSGDGDVGAATETEGKGIKSSV